jgi:hypothetical protein
MTLPAASHEEMGPILEVMAGTIDAALCWLGYSGRVIGGYIGKRGDVVIISFDIGPCPPGQHLVSEAASAVLPADWLPALAEPGRRDNP